MATTFIVAFSAVFGTAEAIRLTQSDARRKEHRSRKNNLIVHCPKSSQYSPILQGRSIVLSGDKLYVDTGTAHDVAFGHPFAGYFLAYPDAKYSGLVSTISADEPPVMNWIYVDAETHEVKFGTRVWAQPHYTGPFDCTRQDRRLTFGGWEGFYLVQEQGGPFWALYFDVDQDQLRGKVETGVPVIEVELQRMEMRVQPMKSEDQAEEDATATNVGSGPAEEAPAASRMPTGEDREREQQEKQGHGEAKDAAPDVHAKPIGESDLESPDLD